MSSPAAQLSLGALGGIVLGPDALEEQRGAWSTPTKYAKAVGPHDVDPFTNPRSTIVATRTCMLERGDDGFGLDRRSTIGTYYINPAHCELCNGSGWVVQSYGLEGVVEISCPDCGYHTANEHTRVWIQPDYEFVLEAIAHYGHTRFTALLRLDTSTEWFDQLWSICEVVMVPHGDRIEFVPPPGVKASSNPFPHGVYYRHANDVTFAIRELCYPWPTPLYPWARDPLQLLQLQGATP